MMYEVDEDETEEFPDSRVLTYDEYMSGYSVLNIKEWTTYFGPEFEDFDFGFKRGMFGKSGLLIKSSALLIKGHGIREVTRITGQSKNTIKKLKRVLETVTGKTFLCPCGGPSGHQGWCSYRFQSSQRRQDFIKRWKESQKVAA